MFKFVWTPLQPIGDHPLPDTLFLHIAWKYKPSQPIGDYALWPCPLRVVCNFVRRSYAKMGFWIATRRPTARKGFHHHLLGIHHDFCGFKHVLFSTFYWEWPTEVTHIFGIGWHDRANNMILFKQSGSFGKQKPQCLWRSLTWQDLIGFAIQGLSTLHTTNYTP